MKYSEVIIKKIERTGGKPTAIEIPCYKHGWPHKSSCTPHGQRGAILSAYTVPAFVYLGKGFGGAPRGEVRLTAES